MNKIFSQTAFILCALFSSHVFASKSCGHVTIADMNWNTATFLAQVDKFILENAYDCSVDLVPGDTIPTTTSMIEKGYPDIAPELWTNSSREILDKGIKAGKLAYAGHSLSDGGEEGFYVPKYMVDKDPSLATIEGIIAHGDLFKHPENPDKYAFYTCPSGWTCQISAGHIFDALNLKNAGFEKVDPGSAGALAGSIAKAYSKKAPWFGYYWGPTAVLGKYPMVKVDFGHGTDPKHYANCITQEVCKNPKPIMWPALDVQTVVTGKFANQSPQVMAYLNTRSFTNAQLNQLLAWMEDNQADGEMAMFEFMSNHQEIWKAWLPPKLQKKVESGIASFDWVNQFPALDKAKLASIRKTLDSAYLNFSRAYGDKIEGFFDPLLSLLVNFENLLLATPWWLVILVITSIGYFASRSIKLTLGVIVSFTLIGLFGMWDDTMRTMSIILIATLLTIGIGVPVGICMASSNRVEKILKPILDIMQTMPAFVYLIPVVMLLGIGRIPGLLAVLTYAIAPVIRLTNLGIRLVDKEVLEAATAYGASPRQRLFGVQIPLAMPTIMAGINQTIMMALAMVVIASMIGVKGLGQPVLKSITNQYFTLGLLNGLAIVAMAIIFDRITQAYAKRSQQHLTKSQ